MAKTVWSIEEHIHGFVMEIVNDKDERERVEIDWDTAKWLKQRLVDGIRRENKRRKEE